ncbi:MAG: hypothetical protein Q9157_005132 [Trypethelium eluteriae]
MTPGVVLGGVSLAIALTDKCLKSYEVVTAALRARDDFRSISLQFEIEQSRLRHFAHATNLEESGENGTNGTSLEKTTVLVETLSEIRLTLERYANGEETEEIRGGGTSSSIALANIDEPSDPRSFYSSLAQRLSLNFQPMQEDVGTIRRFTWTSFQRGESERVIVRLSKCNDYLHELLSAHEVHNLQIQQRQQYLELVQMQTTLDGIRELTEAAQATRSLHYRSSPWQHAMDEELENLARFKSRSALVFKNPDSIEPDAHPVSLLNALEACDKPSLTHRIALAHKLAQFLLYLHAVNWLHKALRSSNVLIFPSSNLRLDMRSPFVTGFDNSRRSRYDEATTDVPRIGWMEAYRHPDTQLDGPNLPYRKTFDIFSLGIVMIEIALWRPIVSIMGIEETMDRSSKATRTVRERWLKTEPDLRSRLQGEVGEKYADVVETCLKGRDAYDIERNDLETTHDTGIKIQRGFNSMVVRALASIVV